MIISVKCFKDRQKMLSCYVFVILYLSVATCLSNEGDSCVKDDIPGTCVKLIQCPTALQGIREKKYPQLCSFNASEPVVCCVEGPKPSSAATPPPVHDQSTTLAVNGGCAPISANLTSTKTGQRAWDKCIEYQEQLIYPCDTAGVSGDKLRSDQCTIPEHSLVLQPFYRGQLPHMVLLGHGNESASAQWLCAGSLVSDRFILTAAHCTYSPAYGPVTFAVLGAFDRSDTLDSSKVYRIKTVIRHPDFKPPRKFNDIALLETEKQMKLDRFAIPACLDVGREPSYGSALATGWDIFSSELQGSRLFKFSEAECAEKHPRRHHANWNKGFDSKTQLCYGDKFPSKDTCQGDSGGPLQMKNKNVYCMHTVVGVTSFGNDCSTVTPGYYTRVAAYVPWIESIVWP